LAHDSRPGLTPAVLAARLDAIEATGGLRSVLVVSVAVGVASGAFGYLKGGGLVAILAASPGRWLRPGAAAMQMFRRHLNQYVVTGRLRLCRRRTSTISSRGPWCRPGCRRTMAWGSSPPCCSSCPAFRWSRRLLDLLQHQTIAGIVRLVYGMVLLLAAAFGLGIVAALAGFSGTASPSPPDSPGP